MKNTNAWRQFMDRLEAAEYEAMLQEKYGDKEPKKEDNKDKVEVKKEEA